MNKPKYIIRCDEREYIGYGSFVLNKEKYVVMVEKRNEARRFSSLKRAENFINNRAFENFSMVREFTIEEVYES